MANEYLDDHEQAEAVKKWIRDNGGAVLIGVVLALGGLFGWRYWQDYQAQQKVAAARSYTDLVSSLTAAPPSPDTLSQFEAAHGSTAYAGFAALAMAQAALDEGNAEAAVNFLERAVEIARPQALRQVAGLRLARVLASLERYDEALAAAEAHGQGAFAALGAEIRGDILVRTGDLAGAREAYAYALRNLEAGSDRNLLQMKLDDLGAGEGGDGTT